MRQVRIGVLSVLFLGGFSLACFAAGDFLNYQYNFFLANRLYTAGEYKKAVAEYKKILNAGFESGNIYYNIGNSYFKLGRLGKAILNYERARRLIPRDSDLEANLRYALSLVKGGLIPHRMNFFMKFLSVLRNTFTIDELTVMAFLVYVLLIIAASLWIRYRWSNRYFLSGAAVLVCVLAVLLLCLEQKVSLLGKEAVVVSEVADAKYEPFDKATNYFLLYEGMEVTVLECNENWCKVRRRDGRTGWVKKSSIERI